MEISKAITGQQMDLTAKSQSLNTADNSKIIVETSKINAEATQEKQSFAEQLKEVAQKLNDQVESLNANVRFGYNDKINSMYLSVTEKSTGKEIRQIPSEEAMRLSEHFREVIGMIFDKES